MREINGTQLLSEDFLEAMMDNLTQTIAQSIKNIEKEYTVKSRFLNKRHACIYADVSPKTLDDWLAKGLPISKIEGCYRIDIKEIEKFMIKNLI